MRTIWIPALAGCTALLSACGATDIFAADDEPATWEVTDPWGLVDVAADGTELQIAGSSGGCGDVERVDVTETDDTVVLHAIRIETEGVACATVMRDWTAIATLDAPLGDRSLLGCLFGGPEADCR